MLPASGVTCQVEPEDEAYCTDQPSTLTVSLPLLCSSMKSLFRVAPELPPPPYTWLITTCACAAQTPQDNSKASASRRANRSEEHTSELQSLMRISYAVFCLKKKNPTTPHNNT